MAEHQVIQDDAVSNANGDLCAFSSRWEHDGDYLRCRACQRPQLTNYARFPFPHVDGCKGAALYEPHPWLTLVKLLAPLSKAVAGG